MLFALLHGVFISFISNWLMPKYERYSLVKKTRESPSVWTLEFAPKEGEVFSYRAGQFAIVKNIHVPPEIKHNFRSYSILHPFDGKKLCFGIKVEGEFTAALAGLSEGSEVEISGPFGLFGIPEEKPGKEAGLENLEANKMAGKGAFEKEGAGLREEGASENLASAQKVPKYVFLAGGVGITPLLCMIEELLQKGKKGICLFYSNKYLEEVAYKKLLDGYAAKYLNLKLIYSITRECPPGVKCETGHIGFNVIKKHCPEMKGAHFFICGSKGFADAINSQLLEGGVGKERVHCEKW